MFVLNYSIILAQTTVDPGLALGQGGAGGTQAVTETAVYVPVEAGGGGFFGDMNMMSLLLMYVAIIGVAWFLLIRPQRKQQKQMRELQEGLKTGDNIITSSGTYGTIVEVNEETFIVEFGSGKSVRIPIAKNHVVGLRDPK